jgi:alpha-beta hydrolase superfamily lysophospholipase
MSNPIESPFPGVHGRVEGYAWIAGEPRYLAVIAHGYSEHARRYDHVAEALLADGAAVYALDHHGHGRSEGERALALDVQDFVTDLSTRVRNASERYGQPVVLIGP